MPFSQLVPEPLPDPQSTGGKGDEEFCHFSDPESHGEGSQAEPAEDGTSSEDSEELEGVGSEEKLEGVLEVTPQLDSGGTTPIKLRSVPVPNIRVCGKSPPKRLKIKRIKSPSGETPDREVVARQNATDLMDEDVKRWVVAADEPRKELFFY